MNRRMTKQREQVYRVLLHLYHPTAEEVYTALHAESPSVGRATVFRNLSVLTEEGKIVKLLFADGIARYDATVDGHAHCVCLGCGSILDLPLMQPLPHPPREQFTAESCEINFYGLCRNCRDRSSTLK